MAAPTCFSSRSPTLAPSGGSNGNTKLQSQLETDRGTVLGPDLFSVQCSYLGFLLCSSQCSDGDTKLHPQRGTVLWPEVGSNCCALGGPDLFSVQRSVLGALQSSFQ